MRTSLLAVTIGFALLSTGLASAREWADDSGKFKIEAEFVAVKDGRVVLEKPDGSYLSVPLDKLSKPDQEFVKLKTSPPAENPFEEVANSKKVTSSATGNLSVVKLKTKGGDGKPGEVRRFREQGWGIKSLAFSPNGNMLAAGKPDSALQLFDVNEESRLDFSDKLETLQSVSLCKFTPNGAKLIAGGRTGLFLIWDVTKDGRLKPAGQFAGHSQDVTCISFSADGKLAISGGEEKRVRYWNVETGKELGAIGGFEGKVKACLMSPDGKTAFATDGATLLALDLEKQETVKRAKLTGSWAAGQFAAFSPDYAYVAAGDSYDVRIWELKTGKELPKLEDREIQWSGEFTPDGTRLISGGSGKINVWDFKKTRRISAQSTAGSYYVQCLATSPDNEHVAAIPGSAGQDLVVLRIPGVDD